MKRLICFMLLSTALLFGASEGSFLGQIVNGPDAGTSKKWIYVQGANGASRKVEVSDAKVRYTPEVPKAEREGKPSEALREGARVRVTAAQDAAGDWKASEIEIVKTAPR